MGKIQRKGAKRSIRELVRMDERNPAAGGGPAILFLIHNNNFCLQGLVGSFFIEIGAMEALGDRVRAVGASDLFQILSV